MRIFPLIAVASAFVAVPAAADVVHQTSLEHEGETVSVSYEPRTKTSLKQRGLGPRTAQSCAWKTEVSIERKIAGADGRSIDALTRTVSEARSADGVLPGYCNQVRARQTAPFGGDRAQLQAFIAEAAARDAGGLRTELASLGSLGRGASR